MPVDVINAEGNHGMVEGFRQPADQFYFHWQVKPQEKCSEPGKGSAGNCDDPGARKVWLDCLADGQGDGRKP